MSANKEIDRGIKWSIALSVMMIVSGVLAIILPAVSGIAVTILVGWMLVLGGVAHLAYSWHSRHGGGLFWGMFLGIIYIAAGGYILLHPMAGLESLTLVVAAYLFVGSTLEFILSFQLRRLNGSDWLLVDAIITLILAIMIWRAWPSSIQWVVGTLMGISMLFSGFARLTISLAARRVANAIGQEASELEQNR
jgi:uncharacterized membrane protein HdeD (DUF308 family)